MLESRFAAQVRGFVSKVDGSVQPIGLVVPADVSPQAKDIPLYVWLHGRGDKATDLHFLCERLDKNGEVVPPGAIVLHPFGRQCVAIKAPAKPMCSKQLTSSAKTIRLIKSESS